MEPGHEHLHLHEFFDHLLLLSSASADKPQLVEQSGSHRLVSIAFGNPPVLATFLLRRSAGGRLNSSDGATGGLVWSKKISREDLEVTQE